MSKPVKNLITQTYRGRFADIEGAVLIDIRGLPSNGNNQLRAGLAAKKIRVTVVQNNLAKRAFKGTKMESAAGLLTGPSALVFGGGSVVEVARELVKQVKDLPQIQFKGALMDGQLFAANQIDALSKYPTRAEAQAVVVQLFLSPARKISGQAKSPGAKLAGIIKALQLKLEKGETIAKISA